MPITVLLSESGAVRIFGIDGSLKDDSVEIRKLKLVSGNNRADLELGSPILLPGKLLEKPEGGTEDDRVFRKLPEVVDEEMTALRERLRNDLSQEFKIKIEGSNTFFGVQKVLNSDIHATLRLRLPSLDGVDSAKVILAARARAGISVKIGNAISATLVLAVDVAAGVNATILWEVPSWPAFNLPLPQFEFPNLNFSNLKKLLPDKWPSFALPTLPFAENLTFKWTTQPNLRIDVDAHGVLTLQTADPANGSGDLWSGDPKSGVRIASLTGFAITTSANQPSVVGEVTLSKTWTPPDRTISAVPAFDIGLKGITVSAKLDSPISQPQPDFQITITVQAIRIQAKKDPSLFIVLKAKVTVNIQAQQILTTIEQLEVIEPYPVGLIVNGTQARVGVLLRLSLSISTTLPNLLPLLNRIAEMLAAAVVWVLEEAGQAAQGLAGVAESGLALLKKAIATILQSGAKAPVQIEIRLDPATYRLRQILVTPRDFSSVAPAPIEALGLKIASDLHLKPCIVLDLGEHPWIGLALVNESKIKPSVTLSTDLWLVRSTSAAQPLKAVDQQSGQKDATPLLVAKVTFKREECAVVLCAFQEGRITLFQKSAYGSGEKFGFVCVGETGALEPLAADDVGVELVASALNDRLTNLLTRPKQGSTSKFLDALEAHVKVTSTAPTVDLANRKVTIPLSVIVTFRDFAATTNATLNLSLRDLSARLEGADRISISLPKEFNQAILGFQLIVEEATSTQDETFYLDLSGGKEEFGLGKNAKASLTLPGLGSNGGGLRFNIDQFRIGRDGLNLSAATQDDPVTLGGVNMPFRFQSGKIEVINSQFKSATLSGSGQLPPALIGEANVSIHLRLRDDGGHVVVDSAEAKLDKGDNPIVCESTRFRFSISKLEMAFEREGADRNGNYHFYFLLTGKARFQPRSGEFTSGLLKNLGELEIVLDRAPLTTDGRLLMQRISFQVKVDPPKKGRFFDLFEFELRGIGLHPSSPAFDGNPAVSISGQVKFTSFADKVQPTFRFHELWIAPPKQGEVLPQVRFDGLTVGLDLGGMAEVEGTAVSVDGSLPTLFRPGTLPANVTANGFLASGRLSIKGWASMSAAMGFLELRKKGTDESHLAFFLYIQENKLSVPIPTPVGKIYLREVGYGYGWRYTLAGIAEAERATTPKDLIRILDDVSKFQGSLDQIEAWTPTYENAALTLAMRAMFSVNSASEANTYDPKKEQELPNPVLFDVVAALRSDLTFLMSVRAWLCVNYADWLDSGFEGRTRPPLRGYLYISVPRQTFLGRFIGESPSFLGRHPDLPAPFRKALEQVKAQYSSTLYITPGLFHFELGWPYELRVELKDRNGDFYVACQGGYVFRVEDGAVLQGYALKAVGFAKIGVDTGGNFGAAVYARADFSIEGKLLSYLSLRAPGETMFYGAFRFDVHVTASVRVWLEFNVLGGTIRWEIGFSFGVTLALGLEVAVLLNRGVGVRAYASIGIQAFGRTLCLGVELRVNGDLLDEARARVDRYLALGLTVSAPQPDTLGRPPVIEPSREERTTQGDKRIKESAQTVPVPPPTSSKPYPTERPAGSQPVAASDFWAMLFPTSNPSNPEEKRYVMQLIPRDQTDGGSNKEGSFYAPMLANSQAPTHAITLPKDGLTSLTLDANNNVVTKPNDTTVKRTYSKRLNPDVWQENFVVWTTRPPDQRPDHCDDPPSVRWEKNRQQLPADDEMAARQLEMSGRRSASLPAEKQRYRQIEERRSAMISAVAHSACNLATAGEVEKSWSFDAKAPLSCLDTGLTFVVSKADLKTLFPDYDRDALKGPPKSPVFTVTRYNDQGQPTDPGNVFLFNPPQQMFVESQPRLKNLSMEVLPGGLALKWDLEPAWTKSENFWTDPEFHLRNYHITRVVSGGADETQRWTYSFNVKSGAPRVYIPGGKHEDGPPAFYRPPFQFVDDLTQPPDLPPAVRDLITGKVTKKIARAFRHSFKVTYEIYAEDVAGTRDFGTVHDFIFAPPQLVVDGPRAAEVVVEFSSSIAADVKRVEFGLPETKLSLTYDDKNPTVSNLELSVIRGKPLPGGQYGADAIATAMESVADETINNGKKFSLQKDVTNANSALKVEFPQFDPVTGQLIEPVANKNFYFENEALKQQFETLLQGPETLRFFVREYSSQNNGRFSVWHRCQVHLKVRSGLEPGGRVLVDSVLDNYERPQDLAFDPIAGPNFTDAHAGRLYLIEPNDDDLPTRKFTLAPDPERRIGVRLNWKARPDGLLCNGSPAGDKWRLVGGFHLYNFNTLEKEGNPSPIAVAVLPQHAVGLEPSEMGDMSLIESYYPTNSTRRRWKSKNYTGWFSLAESAPLFPEGKPFRRSFMASVDEGLLAGLFEKGVPSHLELTVERGVLTADKVVLDDSILSSPGADYEANVGWRADFSEPDKLRSFFRGACLKKPLKDGITVSITAYRRKNDTRVELVTKKYIFEDPAHLHPLLADTLDILRYQRNYRRYEIVLDPLPGRTIKDLEGWIDSTPVKSDPYGWGILRTMGLAIGFRVYDTGDGTFVTGKSLVGLVREAFRQAIDRYPSLDIGAPFIDLFTAPLENTRAYSFDGGPDTVTDEKVYQQQLALIQLSLRPRILALTAPETVGVRYFVIAIMESTTVESTWTFTSAANYTVDVFTLGSSAATQHATLTQGDVKAVSFTIGPASAKNLVFALRVTGADVPALLERVLKVEGILKDKKIAHISPPVDLTQPPGAVDEQRISLGVGEVLGLFPPLSGEAWAGQLSVSGYLPRFFDWTERAGLNREKVKEKDPNFAGKLVNWWKRFLDHGWGKASHGPEMKIRESLGSIGKPGKWRVAEKPDGTVGVMLLEDNEYGAMKRYAVRPYGRYDAFVRAVNPELRPAPAIAANTVVDVTLPRTAQVTRPTILSASRVPVEVPGETGAAKGEALELVVALTPDEVISSANQTTSLRLGSDGVSTAFWREFSYFSWGSRILGSAFDCSAPLGGWDRMGPPPDLTLNASNALTELRSRVPDAWLGTWIYRVRALPYFYHVYALVHANAGVVVSEPAGIVFSEGINHFNWFPSTLRSTYRVSVNAGVWKIDFKIPLIAFRDCMVNPELWDPEAGDFHPLVMLPDPAIAYRVSLAASVTVEANKPEVLSTDSQFEISPLVKTNGTEDKLYVVQSVGERMMDAPKQLNVTWDSHTGPGDGQDRNQRYQLVFPAALKGPDLPAAVGSFTSKGPWGLMMDVSAEDFPVWKRFAPAGTARIVYTKPGSAAEESTLLDVCDTFTKLYATYPDAPATTEIVKVLAQIRTLPASQTFEVSNWIVGLPQPASLALVFKSGNDFAWNPNPTGNRQERRLAEKYLVDATVIRADLRRHYLSGSSLYLRQSISEQDFSDPKNSTSQSRICAPYQILTIQRRNDTFDRAALERLFDKLEASPFGAETIAGLGIVEDDFTHAEVNPTRLVLGVPELLDDLRGLFTLDASPAGYFVAWLGPPESDDLRALGEDSAFRRKAEAIAEEAWFGAHRKPRLSAVRGSLNPIYKEIERA